MIAQADGARMAKAILGTAAFARAHGVRLPADLLLDLERVQALAAARGWQLAAKYDPSQPRDPKGTPTGGQWRSGPSAARGDTKEKIAKAFAAANGYPPEKVRYSKTVTGRSGYGVMAEYVSRGDQEDYIIVYPSAPKDQRLLEAVMAHEITHALTYKKVGLMVKHLKRHAGEQAWDARGWRAMPDPGTFTPYLEWVWGQHEQQQISGHTAFNEVLAETARLKYLGEYDQVPWGWRQLYEDIMREARQ